MDIGNSDTGISDWIYTCTFDQSKRNADKRCISQSHICCMDHPGSCKSDGMEMVVYHRWRNDQSFIDEYRSN